MVLCAELADGSKVELLQPPTGSEAGDLITFEDQGRCPPVGGVLTGRKTAWDKTCTNMNISE
jgi:hypothetical protein